MSKSKTILIDRKKVKVNYKTEKLTHEIAEEAKSKSGKKTVLTFRFKIDGHPAFEASWENYYTERKRMGRAVTSSSETWIIDGQKYNSEKKVLEHAVRKFNAQN